MARGIVNLSDMTLLNNPEVRKCIPVENIPWHLTTMREKQEWFNRYGKGYVQIKTDSELKECGLR